MLSMWRIFINPEQAKTKPQVEVKQDHDSDDEIIVISETKPEVTQDENFDDDMIGVVNPDRYIKFSNLGKEICQAVENHSSYKVVDAKAHWYAAQLFGVRFKHHSKVPGNILLDSGKTVSFEETDYFLEVSRQGKVSYQAFVNGIYYPVKLHELDQNLQSFHQENIAVLLEPKVVNTQVAEEAAINFRSSIRPLR